MWAVNYQVNCCVSDSAGSGDAMYMMKPGPGGPPSMGMPGPGVS